MNPEWLSDVFFFYSSDLSAYTFTFGVRQPIFQWKPNHLWSQWPNGRCFYGTHSICLCVCVFMCSYNAYKVFMDDRFTCVRSRNRFDLGWWMNDAKDTDLKQTSYTMLYCSHRIACRSKYLNFDAVFVFRRRPHTFDNNQKKRRKKIILRSTNRFSNARKQCAQSLVLNSISSHIMISYLVSPEIY